MGRSPCCEKAHTIKGAWSKEEDEVLISYIQAHGEVCWRSIPKPAGLQRCGKSCRFRWINYLRPDLKRGNFSQEEDELVIKLHSRLGNKWSLIASRLPGRTDNQIKNYWNTHIKRKFLEWGVDPYTHLPIMPDHGSFGFSMENHVLPKRRCKPSEALIDFFQQQTPGTSSEETIISRTHDHAEDEDVNLDLSITLPSLRSSQGAWSSSQEFSSGIMVSNDCIHQDHKREICSHIDDKPLAEDASLTVRRRVRESIGCKN